MSINKDKPCCGGNNKDKYTNAKQIREREKAKKNTVPASEYLKAKKNRAS